MDRTPALFTPHGKHPIADTWGGTQPIRRFLHPVCFQNMPHRGLPDDLA